MTRLKAKSIIRIVGFSLTVIGAALLFSGCAAPSDHAGILLAPGAWKTYPGPALPHGQDALLKVGYGFLLGPIYVRSVDGRQYRYPAGYMDFQGSKVLLLPGHHLIEFVYSSYTPPGPGRRGISVSGGPITKEICVEAGKTYGVGAILNGKSWSVTITEKTSVQQKSQQLDADAECRLGLMYLNGQSVTRDYARALDWFQKSAAQGNSAAQENLGYMYLESQGVTQDYAQALDYFQKSAVQGNAAAQSYLGWMYAKGRGVTRDYAQALDWFRKSAAQGFSAAQGYLGWMYEHGLGVTADHDHAIQWYRKAANQGNEGAKKDLQRLGIQN